MSWIFGRKKTQNIKPGPVKTKDGIPLDYIVIIDAGSNASRVYVYNWLNPEHALRAGLDVAAMSKVKLHRRLVIEKDTKSTPKEEYSFAEPDSDSDSESLSDSDSETEDKVRFPFTHSKSSWHRKMLPGLANFNESPGKIGNHHLSYLLSLASSVVPKSEHYRTPIFLHATAGMRLLPPNEQEPILENVCLYLQSNSDFYLPHCPSHVNIIDGDVEGLYGWLAINYMMKALDKPEEHDHGKNHTTYGLLDMGGASTQVVFQPNSTEKKDHSNNLYHLQLAKVPELIMDEENAMGNVGNYLKPSFETFDVYSDSFLGFGMLQAHTRYLKVLVDHYRVVHDLPLDVYLFRTPILDPCLPKGYTTSAVIDDQRYDFIGESNFDLCLESIFPVLQNVTHGTGTGKDASDCKLLDNSNRVSSCLLNDLIPAFDFDVNHFIGVSGYWDAMNQFIQPDSVPHMGNRTDNFDYSLIYSKTRELCTQPLQDLLVMNKLNEKCPLPQDDLMELCFKSSWVLNFLHVGLGFPRFGIDKIPNKDDKFHLLQIVEKVDGLKFTWTLGRALLYSNDEYVQAFNNYSIQTGGDAKDILPRPGYYYTAAVGSFYNGAEAEGVLPRPQYSPADPNAKYTYYNYETSYKQGEELKWYIKPHRFYGQLIFILMILGTFILMMGKEGRGRFISKVRRFFTDTLSYVRNRRNGTYHHLQVQGDIESSSTVELEMFPPVSSKSLAEQEFAIGSEEDE